MRLTSLVFPGAEHSRFTHSLGATHVMVRLLGRMRSMQAALPPEQRIDDAAESEVIAAVLLHDLGHGPFSHSMEEIIGLMDEAAPKILTDLGVVESTSK